MRCRLQSWPDFHCVVLVLWLLTVVGCLLEPERCWFVHNPVKVHPVLTAVLPSAFTLLFTDGLNVCLHSWASSLMESNFVFQDFYITSYKLLGNGHFSQLCSLGPTSLVHHVLLFSEITSFSRVTLVFFPRVVFLRIFLVKRLLFSYYSSSLGCLWLCLLNSYLLTRGGLRPFYLCRCRFLRKSPGLLFFHS